MVSVTGLVKAIFTTSRFSPAFFALYESTELVVSVSFALRTSVLFAIKSPCKSGEITIL